MELKDRSRTLRCDGAAYSLIDRVSLICTAGDQKNTAGSHNAADAHGQGLLRHIVSAGEKPGVGFDGALCQMNLKSRISEKSSKK